jgi:hypothetical protein
MGEPNTEHICCFCTEEVTDNPPDICSLQLVTEWTGPEIVRRSERLFCHAQCLRRVVHDRFPLDSLDEGWD